MKSQQLTCKVSTANEIWVFEITCGSLQALWFQPNSQPTLGWPRLNWNVANCHHSPGLPSQSPLNHYRNAMVGLDGLSLQYAPLYQIKVLEIDNNYWNEILPQFRNCHSDKLRKQPRKTVLFMFRMLCQNSPFHCGDIPGHALQHAVAAHHNLTARPRNLQAQQWIRVHLEVLKSLKSMRDETCVSQCFSWWC